MHTQTSTTRQFLATPATNPCPTPTTAPQVYPAIKQDAATIIELLKPIRWALLSVFPGFMSAKELAAQTPSGGGSN